MARGVDHDLQRELYDRVQRDPVVLEFLVSGALDGLWYWDLEYPEHEWLSPRLKEVLGLCDDEMARAPEGWQARIDPGDLARAQESFRRHLADRDHRYDQLLRCRHRDGSTVWIRCRGMAIRDEQGQPIRMLVAYVDVTGLMASSEERHHLERANEELQTFTQIISHDLRAPLRNIIAFGELLDEEAGAELGADAQLYLHHIRSSAQRMQRLLAELLNYARVDGECRAATTVELDDVVDQVMDSMETQLKEARAEVVRAPLPRVRGRHSQLLCLFGNLVANALKFRGDRPARIEISADMEAAQVEVRVADHGLGFDMRYAGAIFRPFRQLHARGQHDGVGMGLAICRKIVEAHGGSIRAESQRGAGTQIVFTLPGDEVGPPC
ncbi:MAG: ATP-binding protein [Sandaracinaceae bacterium]